MSAGEPIVLASSSPPPARSHDKTESVVGPEYFESLKENLSFSPPSKPSLKQLPIPSAFPKSRPSSSATFKIPEKFSPPRSPAHKAVAIAGPTTIRDVADLPAAKRPRTEPSLGPSTTKSPVKKTKQVKSARTVTRTVLDKYDALDNNVLESPAPGPVDVLVVENAKPDDEATKKKKKATRTKSRKAAKPAPPKLFDPETAHRTIERQSTFFGTSSQLTRAEPLADVRDLQRALQASEASDCTAVSSGTSFVPDERSKMSGVRSLWAEGARGDANFLLEPDPNAIRGATRAFRDEFADIDHVGGDEDLEDEALRVGTGSHLRKSGLLCAGTNPARSESKPTTTEEGKLQEKGRSGPGEAMPPAKRPRGRPRKNQANTDDASTRAPAAPSTPTKSRGKTKAPAAGTPASIRSPSGDSFANIDEIEDPDQEQRSPPRRGAGAKNVRLELSPSQEAQASEVCQAIVKKKRRRKASRKAPPTDEQEIRDWEAEAPILFGLITRAVKMTGSSSSSSSNSSMSSLAKPSWHEKMLLYDPICIEDVTDWLNGGPLAEACRQQDAASEVRWEGQVEAWKVKIWCEQHSVCCYNKDVVREDRSRKG